MAVKLRRDYPKPDNTLYVIGQGHFTYWRKEPKPDIAICVEQGEHDIYIEPDELDAFIEALRAAVPLAQAEAEKDRVRHERDEARRTKKRAASGG